MKIAVVPIDNRPICYDLIQDTLSIDENIELFMPKIEFLGGLTTKSNVEEIFNFLNELPKVDYLIVSLDTIAHGGLVSSRRSSDTLEEILSRINEFKKIAKDKAEKIFAFSSIMRISNNNINEEEKEYWSIWGKRIFDWSYYLHKSEVQQCFNCVINKIPQDILEDYLATRKRNFEINKIYLDWAQEGFFDSLIFSKDDCAEFGLNVKEARELSAIVKEKKLNNILIKTGADEIPLSLISRALCDIEKIEIEPIFLEENSKNLISKYEDISIFECVKSQIEIAGAKIGKNGLKIIVNNFQFEQGDLVLGDIVNNIQKQIDFPEEKYFIADVNNANGADCIFVEQIFKQKLDNFFGYCAYNTSANTIGCAIFVALTKYFAIKNNSYNEFAFKKLQFTRFLDDWAYQAISRKHVALSAVDFSFALFEKKEELNKNAQKISKFLKFYPEKIEYSLPWNRSFEIRILINN